MENVSTVSEKVLSLVTFEEIWAILSVNNQWNGEFGPDGQDPLNQREKKAYCAYLTKQLDRVAQNKGINFYREMMLDYTDPTMRMAGGLGKPGLSRILKTINWFAKRENGEWINPYAQCRTAIALAKGRTEKRLGTSYIDAMADGLLKKAV
jgi:hypothetical protein